MRHVACCLTVFCAAVTCWPPAADAASPEQRGPLPNMRRDRGEKSGAVFLTDVPKYEGNVILGRPTDRSVTASVLLFRPVRAIIAYGVRGEPLQRRTPAFDLRPGEPREVVIDGLEKNRPYEYRVLDAETGVPLLPVEGNGSFHTRREPGAAFAFTVQSDAHLDESTDLILYRRTLENVLAERPDFHIDLGDAFMTGKHASRQSAARQYDAQRYWLGLVGHAAPVFLVLGNHDGEETFRPGADAAGGLAVWANAQRKRFFPNPVASDFYSGNDAAHPHAGSLQNYYAWEWGDGLFVVLDPYWYSGSTRGGATPWNMAIGKAQYDWLGRTLRSSRAAWKFVFIHQLVGGLDSAGRGGAEAAALYEWGGRSAGGQDEFAVRRPGWGAPIHRLLADNGVRIVFHGHDHFFARQELDGVVYQLVPQPAHRNFRNHQAEEYAYRKGDFLPNSGHLLVRVAPERVTVQYIRTGDDRTAGLGVRNGEPAFTYSCEVRNGRPSG
ncbi:MAG: metallophosphoesterase [Planctomycetes bacterium]|nr:metallophosphoesterase [Planctomycetota bacterium]